MTQPTCPGPRHDRRPSRPLPDHVRAFLDDLRFATISTIEPTGDPRQAVVWYAVDGDEIVINSAIGRRWPANLVRDPRLSFTVIDAVDQYRWVGLTGTVRSITDWTTTQADIAAMARRYHAARAGARPSGSSASASSARIGSRSGSARRPSTTSSTG